MSRSAGAAGCLVLAIALGLASKPAPAERTTLRVTATVTAPPIHIKTGAPSGITISTEEAMAYCYAHGLEMHECIVIPEELEEWKKEQR